MARVTRATLHMSADASDMKRGLDVASKAVKDLENRLEKQINASEDYSKTQTQLQRAYNSQTKLVKRYDQATKKATQSTRNFSKSASEATKATTRFWRATKTANATLANLANIGHIGRHIAGVFRGGIAAVRGYTQAIIEAADAGSTLGLQASAVGFDTETLQAYQRVFLRTNISEQETVAALKNFQLATVRASEGVTNYAKAFIDLGISVTDTSGALRPVQELFDEFLQRMDRAAPQVRELSGAMVFGVDVWAKWAGVLASGSDELRRQATAMQRFGTTTEKEAARLDRVSERLAVIQVGFSQIISDAVVTNAETLEDLLIRLLGLLENVGTNLDRYLAQLAGAARGFVIGGVSGSVAGGPIGFAGGAVLGSGAGWVGAGKDYDREIRKPIRRLVKELEDSVGDFAALRELRRTATDLGVQPIDALAMAAEEAGHDFGRLGEWIRSVLAAGDELAAQIRASQAEEARTRVAATESARALLAVRAAAEGLAASLQESIAGINVAPPGIPTLAEDRAARDTREERINEAWREVIIDRGAGDASGSADALRARGAAFGAVTDAAAEDLGDLSDALDVERLAATGLSDVMWSLVDGTRGATDALRSFLDALGRAATESLAGKLVEKVPGLHTGGYHAGGLALVGERGPELVDFGTPGRVYPNHQLGQALRGGNDVNVAVSFNVSGGDARGFRAQAPKMVEVIKEAVAEAATRPSNLSLSMGNR